MKIGQHVKVCNVYQSERVKRFMSGPLIEDRKLYAEGTVIRIDHFKDGDLVIVKHTDNSWAIYAQGELGYIITSTHEEAWLLSHARDWVSAYPYFQQFAGEPA